LLLYKEDFESPRSGAESEEAIQKGLHLLSGRREMDFTGSLPVTGQQAE
jgi:hypothetical protein